MAQDQLRIDDVRPQDISGGGYVDEGDGLESGFHADDIDTPTVPEASPLDVLRYFRRRRDLRIERRDD